MQHSNAQLQGSAAEFGTQDETYSYSRCWQPVLTQTETGFSAAYISTNAKFKHEMEHS